MKWIKNILIAIDQLFNALLAGDPDETISSRCGKMVNSNKFCKHLCKLLNKIDKRHCKKSIEEDEGANNVWGE